MPTSTSSRLVIGRRPLRLPDVVQPRRAVPGRLFGENRNAFLAAEEDFVQLVLVIPLIGDGELVLAASPATCRGATKLLIQASSMPGDPSFLNVFGTWMNVP